MKKKILAALGVLFAISIDLSAMNKESLKEDTQIRNKDRLAQTEEVDEEQDFAMLSNAPGSEIDENSESKEKVDKERVFAMLDDALGTGIVEFARVIYDLYENERSDEQYDKVKDYFSKNKENIKASVLAAEALVNTTPEDIEKLTWLFVSPICDEAPQDMIVTFGSVLGKYVNKDEENGVSLLRSLLHRPDIDDFPGVVDDLSNFIEFPEYDTYDDQLWFVTASELNRWGAYRVLLQLNISRYYLDPSVDQENQSVLANLIACLINRYDTGHIWQRPVLDDDDEHQQEHNPIWSIFIDLLKDQNVDFQNVFMKEDGEIGDIWQWLVFSADATHIDQYLSIWQYLIELNMDPSEAGLMEIGKCGSILHLAACVGNLDVLYGSINLGANPYELHNGRTPLGLAIINNNIDAIFTILHNRSDEDIGALLKSVLVQPDQTRQTALDLLIELEDYKLALQILEAPLICSAIIKTFSSDYLNAVEQLLDSRLYPYNSEQDKACETLSEKIMMLRRNVERSKDDTN